MVVDILLVLQLLYLESHCLVLDLTDVESALEIIDLDVEIRDAGVGLVLEVVIVVLVLKFKKLELDLILGDKLTLPLFYLLFYLLFIAFVV